MKQPIVNIFIEGIVFAVMASCGTHKQQEEDATLYEIDYSQDDKSNAISSIVDSLEFIPLHGSIENPVSHVDELQVTETGVYILDKRRNRLHVYSKDGHHLFTLQSLGHAKEEYLEIACFAVTDSTILVVDNFGKKINEYRSDNGVFKNSYDAPMVVGAVRPLMQGGYILAELPMDGVNSSDNSDGNRLYITDNAFHIKSSACPYGKNRDKIGMGRFLSDNDSVILYASTGYNGFVEISAKDGEIAGNVALNTAMPFNNEEISGMDLSDAMDHIDAKQWQFLTTTPMAVGKYVCLSVKNNESAEPSIYDADSGKLYFNDGASMHNNMIAPDDSYGDSFYTVYNFGGEFLDEQLKTGFNQPPVVADSIIRKDGAVLLRYRMKDL